MGYRPLPMTSDDFYANNYALAQRDTEIRHFYIAGLDSAFLYRSVQSLPKLKMIDNHVILHDNDKQWCEIRNNVTSFDMMFLWWKIHRNGFTMKILAPNMALFAVLILFFMMGFNTTGVFFLAVAAAWAFHSMQRYPSQYSPSPKFLVNGSILPDVENGQCQWNEGLNNVSNDAEPFMPFMIDAMGKKWLTPIQLKSACDFVTKVDELDATGSIRHDVMELLGEDSTRDGVIEVIMLSQSTDNPTAVTNARLAIGTMFTKLTKVRDEQHQREVQREEDSHALEEKILLSQPDWSNEMNRVTQRTLAELDVL